LAARFPTVPRFDGDGVTPRSISVVIPARNERLTLPRLLLSLAEQTRRADEIVVIDDMSSDGTGEAAMDGGASVVTVSGLPVGWTGKTWACELGRRRAGGELLVFLDADTWLAPDGLERLARAYDACAAGGLLSVQPFHVAVRPHEQLSSVCNAVAVLGSGIGLRRTHSARTRVAFGPCLVTTPDALGAAGGFAAVKSDVVEDIALAGRYRDAGRKVSCLVGGDAISFRMYPSAVRSLVQGWTKNLAGGARRAPIFASLGVALWIAAALSVAIHAAVAPTLSVGVAWVAFAVQLRWILRRLGSFRWWAWALFPVTVTAFVLLFVVSIVRRAVRREVIWRDRRIRISR